MAVELPPMPSTLSAVLGRPFWNEGRAPLEFARLRRTTIPLPPGDGRRVVVATGYLAGPGTARPLATWLGNAGYRVDVADVGRNTSTSTDAVDRIVAALEAGDGEPAVLIGHSRGGQQSRVATQRVPDLVAGLITLGAPVRAHLPRSGPLRASVEAIRLLTLLPIGPDGDLDADADYEHDLAAPFGVDVPWTSIWSRVDGVIEWQACVDAAAESIEVETSHVGLMASVPSFHAIATVLVALGVDR